MFEGWVRTKFVESIEKQGKFGLYSVGNWESVKNFEQENSKMVVVLWED